MQVMPLGYESLNGASHGDDIIVGMGREHHHALGKRLGALRAIGVVGVGLSARPSRDGMLQVVEDLDVGIIGRSIKGEQLGESVLIVVLVGELQDGLLGYATQPYEGCAGEFVGPFAAGHQPGVYDSGELAGCREVYDDVGVVVGLQEAGGYRLRGLSLDGLLDDVGLFFSPCRKICLLYTSPSPRDCS